MGSSFVLVFLVVFSTIFLTVNSLNILVFTPNAAASHKKYMSRMADTLTDAGHNVTLLIADGFHSRKFASFVKSTKDVYVIERDEEMNRVSDPDFDNRTDLWYNDLRTVKMAETYEFFHREMTNLCANFFRNPHVFEDMKKRNFDVAMTEPLSVYELAFFKKLGIEKVILSSSVTAYDFIFPHIGEPLDHSYVPASCSDLTDVMSITERYENRRIALEFNNPIEKYLDKQMKVYRQVYGEDYPDWRELVAQASLYFTNSNPYIDWPRPVIQKTIAIGGISVDMNHIRSQKLPQEWDQILNLRKKSMFISFGTIVRSIEMPEAYRQNILNVIKLLPNVTFIWKYESDDIAWASEAPNLILTKWAPQPALLVDSRLTAFLTHGGLGSVYELSYCGKPALVVPVAFDQSKNANFLARLGGVTVLNKFDLGNEEKVLKSFHSVLYDERLDKNAKKVAAMLENLPYKPADLLVRHTEFVAKYGPFPQMDPHVRHLNYFQRTFLDIYLITVFCYISIGLGSLLLLKYVLSKTILLKNNKK